MAAFGVLFDGKFASATMAAIWQRAHAFTAHFARHLTLARALNFPHAFCARAQLAAFSSEIQTTRARLATKVLKRASCRRSDF